MCNYYKKSTICDESFSLTGDLFKSGCYAFVRGRGMKTNGSVNSDVMLRAYFREFEEGNFDIDLQYQVAQMYAVMKMQQQSTTGAEGVEILENKPFEDAELGKGHYTKKIYRLQSKAPSWLTTFAPADALIMQEEAWNAYPRCKSVIKCPYFTKLSLTIETIHKADSGGSENALGLNKKQLAARQVDTIDISAAGTDYWSYLVGDNNTDFSKFQSAITGRGPLLEGWQDQCYPVMTAYKLVTVDAPYWGFGSKLEQALLSGERALFLELHRNCFAWIDEWIGLTLDVMRELEKQSDFSLNEKLGRVCLPAKDEEFDNKTRISA